MGDRIFTRLFLAFLFFCGSVSQVFASHVMGGSATYRYLGNNKYAISFIFYKDCQNSSVALPTSFTYYIVPASSTLTFSQLNSSSNASKYQHTIKLLGGTVTDVSSANAACGSSYCTDRGYYNDTFTEGTDTTGYNVFVETSARNNAITNLALTITGGQVQNGITLSAYIPPRGTTNNSPQLTKDMTPTICVNKPNIFNAGFYDPDGDSLVFSFVYPVDLPANNTVPPKYPTINFKSGYSLQYPFGTSGYKIQMDSTTGVITAEPTSTGYYIVTIQIQDYRVNKLTHKGVLMATTRVDLEFVAVNCGSTTPPKWAIDSTYKRTVSVGQNFCFEVKSYDT